MAKRKKSKIEVGLREAIKIATAKDGTHDLSLLLRALPIEQRAEQIVGWFQLATREWAVMVLEHVRPAKGAQIVARKGVQIFLDDEKAKPPRPRQTTAQRLEARRRKR